MITLPARDYALIKHLKTGKLLRFSFFDYSEVPDDYVLIPNTNRKYYKKNEELKPQYWALERYTKGHIYSF
jgi:hypothetical protein